MEELRRPDCCGLWIGAELSPRKEGLQRPEGVPYRNTCDRLLCLIQYLIMKVAQQLIDAFARRRVYDTEENFDSRGEFTGSFRLNSFSGSS